MLDVSYPQAKQTVTVKACKASSLAKSATLATVLYADDIRQFIRFLPRDAL